MLGWMLWIGLMAQTPEAFECRLRMLFFNSETVQVCVEPAYAAGRSVQSADCETMGYLAYLRMFASGFLRGNDLTDFAMLSREWRPESPLAGAAEVGMVWLGDDGCGTD